MFNSILTWEQMAKQWILLNFLVRSKNYTFSETLEHYKKTEHSAQFFFGHFVDFQGQNIMACYSMVSQNIIFSKM